MKVTLSFEPLLAEIAAGAAERSLAGSNPVEAIDAIRRARLGALRVPVEAGGFGASVRELFEILIALADADSHVAHILRAHFWFVEERLIAVSDPAQDRWLAEVASGAIFGNAMTELAPKPVGSNEFETTLIPKGNAFVLRGTKYYTTGSLFSNRVAVIASDADGQVVTALVPADREGVTLEDDWDGIGQELSGSGTSRFDDVAVLPEEVLSGSVPQPDEPRYIGAFLQLFLTAVIAGNVRRAVSDAVDVVRSRKRTFSHAPATTATDDPLLQASVGRLASAAFAAESVVLAAADALDAAVASLDDNLRPEAGAAHRASIRAAEAKVVVDELAQRAGSEVFDVGGASAIARSANLDRHWRNVRTLASHNPAAYKAQAVGDNLINGTPLPDNGFF